jgi:hypothetical protein
MMQTSKEEMPWYYYGGPSCSGVIEKDSEDTLLLASDRLLYSTTATKSQYLFHRKGSFVFWWIGYGIYIDVFAAPTNTKQWQEYKKTDGFVPKQYETTWPSG